MQGTASPRRARIIRCWVPRRPLEYDREQELGMLEKQDSQLRAQAVRLERTTKNLEEQKRQLQKHYKETEDVGKKLNMYKGKLAAVRRSLCSRTHDTDECAL